MTKETRIALPSDAPSIALLGRITFSETFGHLFRDTNDLKEYLQKTFSVEKIEAGIRKKNNVFWISFIDRLPVGYAKLKLHSASPFIRDQEVCQLQKIYVLNDFLSHKIGFDLQNQLLARAQSLGYQQIWLSVLDANERAKAFYVKNGFEKIGDHEFRIGQERFDFIAMRKYLSA
jgi:ribosomal protein S18 acetylase RimI-like enzyme